MRRVMLLRTEVRSVLGLAVGSALRTGFECLVETVKLHSIYTPLMGTGATAHIAVSLEVNCSFDHRSIVLRAAAKQ